jgi:hypothetical protein
MDMKITKTSPNVKKVENGIPKYILDVKTILEGC